MREGSEWPGGGRRGRGGVEERTCHFISMSLRSHHADAASLSAASPWEWRDRIASFHRCHARPIGSRRWKARRAARRWRGSVASRHRRQPCETPPAFQLFVAFLARRCCSERKVTPSSHRWRARLTRHCSHRRIVSSAVETFSLATSWVYFRHAPKVRAVIELPHRRSTERFGERTSPPRSSAPTRHSHTACGGARGRGAVTRGRERRGRERRGTEAISRLQLFVLLRLAVLAQAAPAAEHAPLREADGRGLRRLVDRRAAVAERGAHRRLPPMHPEAERVCAVLVDDRGLGRRRRLRRRRCRAP